MPEPATFDQEVRIPGAKYLHSLAVGENPDFKGREYWRDILAELHSAYSSVCAYTCHWIPLDTGSDTVEHFIPKSVAPAGAYEWSNFRLVCGRLNGRKSDFQDVVDPFLVQDNMFEIHFPSLEIRPSSNLQAGSLALAQTTISRLKLNDARCVGARMAWLKPYIEKHITRDFLKSKAPFLAAEISRQNFTLAKLKAIMKPAI